MGLLSTELIAEIWTLFDDAAARGATKAQPFPAASLAFGIAPSPGENGLTPELRAAAAAQPQQALFEALDAADQTLIVTASPTILPLSYCWSGV